MPTPFRVEEGNTREWLHVSGTTVARTMHEQRWQVTVPACTDAEQLLVASGRMSSRN